MPRSSSNISMLSTGSTASSSCSSSRGSRARSDLPVPGGPVARRPGARGRTRPREGWQTRDAVALSRERDQARRGVRPSPCWHTPFVQGGVRVDLAVHLHAGPLASVALRARGWGGGEGLTADDRL